MRISDWSSDVCSSDLEETLTCKSLRDRRSDIVSGADDRDRCVSGFYCHAIPSAFSCPSVAELRARSCFLSTLPVAPSGRSSTNSMTSGMHQRSSRAERCVRIASSDRSEEHTSELQSLMRISYAVFCLKKKKKNTTNDIYT